MTFAFMSLLSSQIMRPDSNVRNDINTTIPDFLVRPLPFGTSILIASRCAGHWSSGSSGRMLWHATASTRISPSRGQTAGPRCNPGGANQNSPQQFVRKFQGQLCPPKQRCFTSSVNSAATPGNICSYARAKRFRCRRNRFEILVALIRSNGRMMMKDELITGVA